MNRILRHLRPIAASPSVAAALLTALLLAFPAAASFCNNPTPPCDPNDRTSACYKPPPPPPKCEPKECNKCTKSPCYVASGAYEWSAQDLSITTTGMPIDIRRLYRSTHAIDGESGYGWVSSVSARIYYAVYLKSAPSTYQKEVNVRLTNGSIYRFVENANGTFTPPEGRFDTLVHNADGTWDLWLQRSMSRFHFGANGNLLNAVDDYGNTQTWTYVNDRISRIADSSGSGRYVDITHGADGRISDVTDMTGRNVHYTYNASGVLTSVTNAGGQSTAYSYVNGKYVPLLSGIADHWGRNITAVTYDAQDRVTSYTEKGETFTYTYNYNGNAVQTAKKDSSNNTWVYTFGNDGLVSASAPPGGGSAASETYYPNGLVQMKTDGAGVKTYFTYNARGNPLTVTNDYQGATAVEWRYVYDPNFPDKPLSCKPYVPGTNTIDPNWQSAELEYYQAGSNAPGALYRYFQVADDGTTKRLVLSFTYDTHGRLLTATDVFGNVAVENTYAATGDLLTATRPANNDAGTRPVTTFAYDTLGRTTSVTGPLGHVTTLTYDALDRVVTITRPKPSPSSTLTFTTTRHYDEFDAATQLLFIREVDPAGRTTKLGIDQYEQLARDVDAAGNIRRYVYTKGLATATIDSNNYTTTYAYDTHRRRTLTTYPDGTTELYTYTADGRIASRRTRANETIDYTYDRHGRAITKSYPNGGLLTRTYVGQKLTTVTDTFSSPSETYTYTYDNWLRIASETQATRGTITRTYADDDRPLTVSVAGGATATYAYYPDRSLRTIAWSPVSGVFRYDYDLSGKTQSVTFPNGQTRTYTWDGQGRLTQLANVHPVTGTLATFAYGYDVDAFTGQATQHGLRTTVTATVPALSLAAALTKFGYDTRAQLIQAVYPAGAPYNALSQSWTYDALGNRLTETENGTTATYLYYKLAGNPLNTDRLQSDGANTYTYDAKGNTIGRSGTRGNYTFSYDYDNRLRSVNGDTTAGYLYDTTGRRSLKTENGAATTFLYNRLHAIAQGGAAPAEYLFGIAMDEALATFRNGQIYYYAVDALGSVVVLNDAAGAVQNSYAWDAFGNARAQTTGVPDPLRFTAREEAVAGRLFYRARYYEPAAGRFDREDPWRWRDELRNMYRYPGNQPTMQVDPLGKGGLPSPVKNCDPVPYSAVGNDGFWDDTSEPVIIPPAWPGGVCRPTWPWVDIDWVCTPNGWRKMRGPVEISNGIIHGWDRPPIPEDNFKPPHECPLRCPAPAPPAPAGPPAPPGSPPPPSVAPPDPLG